MKACRVCKGSSCEFGSGRYRDWVIVYSECRHCGYIQANGLGWLEDAYASPMNVVDTGIMVRNIRNVDEVLACLTLIDKCKAKRVVDMAGGYGILTRLLRDQGVEAEWADVYTSNLCARGFEYKDGRVDLVTAFEAFEHFEDPVKELGKMLSIGDVVLISTDLAPEVTPPIEDWWYYGVEHGQHIGFFRKKTLMLLAETYGLDLMTNGRNMHVFLPRHTPWWRRLRYRLLRYVPRYILSAGYRGKTFEDYRRLTERSN